MEDNYNLFEFWTHRRMFVVVVEKPPKANRKYEKSESEQNLNTQNFCIEAVELLFLSCLACR